jgi:hypothetical protein
MMMHLLLILLIGLLSLPLGATGPRTGAADISGTWEFTFDLTKKITKGPMTKGPNKGSTIVFTKKASKRVTFVLEQQGEQLTATCCEPEEKMTGAVQGDKVTFEREVSREGEKIIYSGTLETSSKMSGTRKIIGDTIQSELNWIAIRRDR